MEETTSSFNLQNMSAIFRKSIETDLKIFKIKNCKTSFVKIKYHDIKMIQKKMNLFFPENISSCDESEQTFTEKNDITMHQAKESTKVKPKDALIAIRKKVQRTYFKVSFEKERY